MKPGGTVTKPKKKASKGEPSAEGAPGAAAHAAPKKGKEKPRQVKVKGPFVVGAREEEYEVVQRETCHCGGGYEIEIEEIRPPTEQAGPLDILKALCAECGSRVDFQFDISSFYDGSDGEFEAQAGGGAGDGDDGDEGAGGGWLS